MNSTELTKWDCVVLTVGNEKQKELCEKFVDAYRDKYDCRFIVAADEGGNRIGSGGAVLSLLRVLAREMPGCRAEEMRILVVNAGGESKRSINYSVRSKAFANVCLDENGSPLSLLELILLDSAPLSDRFGAGMVVCCSDIPVPTEGVTCSFGTSVGFCVCTDLETASRHGVMFSDENGFLTDYLHKRTPAELRAVEGKDSAPIDTGLTFFAPDFVAALVSMISGEHSILDRLIDEKLELSLYSDLICQMSKGCTRADFLMQCSLPEDMKNSLFNSLHGLSMRVCELENTEFLHFGTVSEAVKNIALLAEKSSGATYFAFNSRVDNSSSVGRGTVLDNALLSDGCAVGKGCLITDIELHGVTVSDSFSVCGIKLSGGGCAAIVCDVDENPKDSAESGKELWNEPRFYVRSSFTESYNCFVSGADSQKVSMAYCIQHADFSQCFAWHQYLSDMGSRADDEKYMLARESIIDDYFTRVQPLKELRCVKEKECVSLPLRVNFSGTWTDAMPYCTDNGGGVVNAAITVDGYKPIAVTAKRLPKREMRFSCDDTGESLTLKNLSQAAITEGSDPFSLHKAVLAVLGATPETVLADGISLSTDVRGIMKGSGLGVSSILLVGCFKAVSGLLGLEISDDKITEMVFVAEQLMKTGGGWQDQAGVIAAGIKFAHSEKGLPQKVKVEQIAVPPILKKLFSERLVLVSTGRRHYGRFVVSDVMHRYIVGEKSSLEALNGLSALNSEIIGSIENDDLRGFASCINKHWEYLKQLSPLITSRAIDSLAEKCRERCDAVCICGAGAGGYLLALLADGETPETLRAALPGSSEETVRKIEIVY